MEHPVGQEKVQDFKDRFDCLGELFKEETSNFFLDGLHSLWCKELEQMFCAYWFIRGTGGTYIVLDISGGIRAINEQFPRAMLKQVVQILEDALED